MKKCYAEKRFFKWEEDEVAVSLRGSSGSYGGGSEVLVVEECVTYLHIEDGEVAPPLRSQNGGGLPMIVLQNNQNNATVGDVEVCPTLPASMGLGGGGAMCR